MAIKDKLENNQWQEEKQVLFNRILIGNIMQSWILL